MTQHYDKVRTTITLDPELEQRIRAVAEKRGEKFSTIVNRMLKQEIKAEEAFVDEMESPTNRAIIQTMAKNPGFVRGFMDLLGEHMSDEELARFTEGAHKQAKAGKKRQASKKKGRRRKGETA